MNFVRETLTPQLIEQLKPLFKAHYEELENPDLKDVMKFEPNYEFFLNCEHNGTLRVYLMRSLTEVIGYWIVFVHTSLHSRRTFTASSDSLYVKQEYRGHGLNFIHWVMSELKAEGVKIFNVLIQAKHDWGKVLRRYGFAQQELAYTVVL